MGPMFRKNKRELENLWLAHRVRGAGQSQMDRQAILVDHYVKTQML